MTDKEPTQKQIKEFAEWCGFRKTGRSYHYEFSKKTDDWLCPDGSISNRFTQKGTLPPIDLNNLFRYAVPKLNPKGILFYPTEDGWNCLLQITHSVDGAGTGSTPVLALFWAIWEVIKKCRN